MDSVNQTWLSDVCLRLLCVMALDRFGDFVSDEVGFLFLSFSCRSHLFMYLVFDIKCNFGQFIFVEYLTPNM